MTKRPPKPEDKEPAPRYKRQGQRPSLSRHAAFDALSLLSKAQPTFEHFKDFHREATAETNPRGAVILIASNIENTLESALLRLLKQERTGDLFGVEKPLGTFRNKIWIAHALDIFGDETFLNLECIRNIRNAFSHSKIPISFDTQEVGDVCAIMHIPTPRPPLPSVMEAADRASPPKPRSLAFFKRVCDYTGHNLTRLNLGGVLRIDRAALRLSFDDSYTEIFAREPPLP